MKRFSIVSKLFIVLIIAFSLFLCIFMLWQTLFFKQFYLNSKISMLKTNLEKFSAKYSNNQWDSNTITENINKFSNDNNSQIAILDNHGNPKYSPAWSIILETKNNGKIKVPLNGIAQLYDFQNLNLSIGSKIDVEGYFDKCSKQFNILTSIATKNKRWTSQYISKIQMLKGSTSISKSEPSEKLKVKKIAVPAKASIVSVNVMPTTPTAPSYSIKIPGTPPAAQKFTRLNGKITKLSLPAQIEQGSNYSNLLWSSIQYWIWQISPRNSIKNHRALQQFHYNSNTDNTDNVILVKPLVKNNKIHEYLFAISSLQPVGEAVKTMKEYYIYAFILALILIIAMALFFSRAISRPLIKMNKVAVKMANLDFSEECTFRSSDELGSLARSLNKLSVSLSTSLANLKSSNAQLHIDIEKEKSLEKMRKEFISSVSHEFKTPLGIIKGFAEGIKDNVAGEKKDYYVDVILDEVDKMDELVQDLLDLSRLESRTLTMNMENFNIIYLIEEVNSKLSKHTASKNVTANFLYSCDTEGYGDRRRIEQVLTNILTNAIQHTEVGGQINIGVNEQNNNELLIFVENSGSHIEADELTKIWDRFYRIEKSRDRKTGGTGLGLSIVKNILEQHQSCFGVENTPIGVKFYFTLRKHLCS